MARAGMKLLFQEKLRTLRADPHGWLAEKGVERGASVADVGAGKGLYALVAAELVGEEGVVYAVEPDPSRAALIERRASEGGLSNVMVLRARAEAMVGIPNAAVDFAFSLYSLHHFEDRKAALSEALRILRNGGRLYVRDFLWSRLLRHGTRREDVSSLTALGFSDVDVVLGRRAVELKFTK